MASGTRTASDITTAPSYRRLSWSVVGINDNKVVTKSVIVSAGATLILLEALVDAIADMSTASLFKIEVTDVFQGAKLQSNATGDGRPSVDDFFVLTGKSAIENTTRRVYVPAPVNEVFLPNSEELDKIDVLVVALTSAWNAVSGNYDAAWINFAEHQESNQPQTL